MLLIFCVFYQISYLLLADPFYILEFLSCLTFFNFVYVDMLSYFPRVWFMKTCMLCLVRLFLKTRNFVFSVVMGNIVVM
jgi:hypothetical protein